MEAKELMIGDWVRLENYPEIRFKIEGLKGGRAFVRFSNNGELFPYVCCEIEPIPLTTEILEKNGFIEEKCERMSIWRLGDFSIECTFTDWVFYWCNGDVELNYLHELQHALRLCGIDKEIVL